MASAESTALEDQRVSRAEALARQLEHEIVQDGLVPGERLGTKEDLRKRFGVAVATVNEAMRLLELRGLIEARPGPGGGVFVASLKTRVRLSHIVLGIKRGHSTIADTIAVRNALDPLVCREAARYSRPADIKAMSRIVDQMQRHVHDPRRYMHLNETLHRRMARICRNLPLQRLYLTLLDLHEDALEHEVSFDEFHGLDNVDVHRELVLAIADGEGPRLEAAIRAHLPTPPSR
jgi:DNA-binding FadR family transcriptional regulator